MERVGSDTLGVVSFLGSVMEAPGSDDVISFLKASPRRSCTTLLDVGPCGTFIADLQALGLDEARFSLVALLSFDVSLILIEWICSGEVGDALVVECNKAWQ